MIETLLEWVRHSGDAVYLLAPLLTVVVAILPIPAEIPAVINGMLFGPLWGSLVSWAGGLLGAQISYEVGRGWGRPIGERVLPAGLLARADAAVARAGWPALLLLRLVPTVAFTAVNWASGLTRVHRPTFVWTTAVGIMPGAVAFTTTGHGFAWLAAQNEYGWVAFWSTVAALAVLTAWFAARRRRDNGVPPAD